MEVEVDSKYDLYIDKLDGFYKSDTWKIIKARLLFLQARLEEDALVNARVEGPGAIQKSNQAEGVKLATNIIEHLAGEINHNEFDVDEACIVIENIASIKETKGNKTWIRILLAKLTNKKK